jgi:hypothetical protein
MGDTVVDEGDGDDDSESDDDGDQSELFDET